MAAESLTLRTDGATVALNTVVRGDEFVWTITLSGAGSISGATVTANVRRRGSPAALLSAIACTITDAANRIVTLTLTEAQTSKLVGNATDPVSMVEHVADVKVVLSGVTTTYGPLVLNVRDGA